jgi:hypothetical protein
VGNTDLPAGEYIIETLRSTVSSNVVLVIRAESGAQATTLANRTYPTGTAGASVVLGHRNGRYWLKRVELAPGYGFQVL